MKKFSYLLAIITLFFCTLAQGDELTTEFVPAVYFNLPFDLTTGHSFKPSIGLQIAKLDVGQNSGVALFSSSEHKLLDMDFSDGGINRVSLNGVEVLRTKTVLNANGTSRRVTESETAYVVAGVLVGGAIIYAIANADKTYICGGTGCPENSE